MSLESLLTVNKTREFSKRLDEELLRDLYGKFEDNPIKPDLSLRYQKEEVSDLIKDIMVRADKSLNYKP